MQGYADVELNYHRSLGLAPPRLSPKGLESTAGVEIFRVAVARSTYHKARGNRGCSCHGLSRGYLVPNKEECGWPTTPRRNGLAPGWYNCLLNSTDFASREEVILAAEETTRQLDKDLKETAVKTQTDEQWERGLKPLRVELHERLPMVEYNVATLQREVEAAAKQLEYNRTLCKMYPTSMEHEKQQLMHYGQHVLQQRRNDLANATDELRLVKAAKRAADEGVLAMADQLQQDAAKKKALKHRKEMMREKYYHNVFRYNWQP